MGTYPSRKINWTLGQMHRLDFSSQFDIVIGNSFLHHFCDVPEVLKRIVGMLKSGGRFISVHEPTPLSIVVESGEVLRVVPAIIAPRLINEVVRRRYGGPTGPDVWLFEPRKLVNVMRQAGVSSAQITPWNLVRPLVVARRGLRARLDNQGVARLRRDSEMDAVLNRVLPARCFGAATVVGTK